jgi:hypothetical protein
MPALQAANEVKAGKDYTQFNWAILLKDGKVGVMNPLGEMITDWSYEDSWPLLLPVKDQAPWLVLKKGGKWGIINGKSEVMIPFVYDEIPPTEYYKTRGAVRYYMPEEPILTRMGNKYGLINGKGEVLVPHEMDKIIPLEKGLFLSSSHLLIKEQRYGFYEGLYYFPPVFDRKVDRIMLFDDYPVARMLDEAGKPLGYGDRKGFYYFEN